MYVIWDLLVDGENRQGCLSRLGGGKTTLETKMTPTKGVWDKYVRIFCDIPGLELILLYRGFMILCKGSPTWHEKIKCRFSWYTHSKRVYCLLSLTRFWNKETWFDNLLYLVDFISPSILATWQHISHADIKGPLVFKECSTPVSAYSSLTPIVAKLVLPNTDLSPLTCHSWLVILHLSLLTCDFQLVNFHLSLLYWTIHDPCIWFMWKF